MNDKDVISDKPFESKYISTLKSYDAASKTNMKMFILPPNVLQNISVNEISRKYNDEALSSNCSCIITNDKYEGTSNDLKTRDGNCAHKDVSPSTRSNSKVPVRFEGSQSNKVGHKIDAEADDVAKESKTIIKLNEINKVPACSRLVATQDAKYETKLMSAKCLNNEVSGIVDTDEKKGVTCKTEKTRLYYASKVAAESKQLLPSVTRDNKMEVLFVEGENMDEEATTREQKMTALRAKSKATTMPAKPVKSLPLDLKDSIQICGKKKLTLNRMQPIHNEHDMRKEIQTFDDNVTHADNLLSLTSETTNTGADSQITDDAMRKDKHNNISESGVELGEQKPNVRKRGRPRKTVNACANGDASNKLDVDHILEENSSTPIGAVGVRRSRRRTGQIAINHNASGLSDESDIAETVEDESLVERKGKEIGKGGRSRGGRRGRGRSRGRGTAQNSSDKEYTPKISEKHDVSRSEETKKNESCLDDTTSAAEDLVIADLENTITSDSDARNAEKDVQLVICAKCEQQIPKKQWQSHNVYKHNNMAWKQSEAKLDFDNDIKLLKRVLTCAAKKKKTLTCEDCGAVKRSVNGFISHIKFCGKTEEERQALMMTCPICNAVMMPSSMEMHERMHRQAERNKNKEASVVLTEKVKRKAAEKAIPKIQQFAESMREQNSCMTKVKLESATLKSAIQMPELKKKIPSVWKGIWKKELTLQGIVSCRQVGCTYTCSSYESICEHYSQCNFTPQQNYMCKICKFLTDSKDQIVNHLTESHSNVENFEKDSDFERDEVNSSDDSIIEYDIKRKNRSFRISQTSSDSSRISSKVSFLSREPAQRPQSTKAYKPTLHWTMTFELENFQLDLFQDYVPNIFTLLRDEDAVKYLPELTSSMAIKSINVDNSSENTEDSFSSDWKRMSRFESDIYGDVPIFFAGGPVWASAWLPIPLPMYDKNPTQYVAISTHPTMESEYSVGKSYSESNIIQIWDVGLLDHESNSKNRSPVLAYAVAHNSGTVWCLEWCPSGCYQDTDLCNYKAEEGKLKRMGLLAAACSDGCVNIYSLPFADELRFERAEHNLWPIYKTEPIARLVVNLSMYDNNKQNWQCSKLSWTRERGHDIIAAGFTNGYIALWDLNTTSPLLLDVREDTRFIDAFQHFSAHHNAVSMVALVPFHGKRYLASASVDRSYKFWDLEETGVPQNCSKKGIIADGAWMTHWPCSVISFDDALGLNCTHSYIMPLREHGYKYCSILASGGPTYTIAVSDYANGIAHGTLAGEILTIFPHQLLYTDKFLPRKRQLNSVVKTIDFSKEQQNKSSGNNDNKDDKKTCKDYRYMPTSYHECKDRFGIIFHDNLTSLKGNIKTDKHQETLHNDKLASSVPIEQHPFMSVNRVTWNPNAWSYLWLMVSYQNGLTRLLNFKYMSAPREMETLLSMHAKSLLAKANPPAQEL